MKHWLCLTNLTNWKIIKNEEIYGFNEQNKKYLSILKNGDKIVIYVIPKKVGGIFKVSNIRYNGDIKFHEGDYIYKIKLEKIYIPKNPLDISLGIIGMLSIFKNTVRWGTVLMGRSIIEITKEDYKYIKELLGK